jgi:hypothetical protein
MDFLNPAFWDGVGVVTVCLLVLVALITGKGLALQREVHKEKEINAAQAVETAANRETIKELLKQNGQFVDKLDVMNKLLDALRLAQGGDSR